MKIHFPQLKLLLCSGEMCNEMIYNFSSRIAKHEKFSVEFFHKNKFSCFIAFRQKS